MKKKIYNVMNKIYGISMTVAFFGGILPLIPFAIAMIIGGEIGEKIALFLYNDYYPWIIGLASVSIVIGLIAMYIGKQKGLSIKEDDKTDEKSEEKSEK